MKALILGDVHYGASYSFGRSESETGINSRLLDYDKTLSGVVSYAIENKIELFIFLGDIFETRNPAPQQIVLFYRQLKRLSDAGITTYVLVGNHDYIKTRHITSSLDPLKEIQLPNVVIGDKVELKKFVDSKNDTLNVVLMPYRDKLSYDKESSAEAILALKNDLELAKEQAIAGSPLLLVGHMMLEGTIPSDAGEYGLKELVLPYDIFAGFDITINGHIHRSSILQSDPPIIYSGSMDCKDFSERDHKKCFIIYDTSKKGIDAIDFRPLKTRKFFEFDLDYSMDFPEDPMKTTIEYIIRQQVDDAVVKLNIKVPETKVSTIDVSELKKHFYSIGANYVSDIPVTPVILRQMRDQKVNDAPDDISAFRHYIASQQNVVDGVLDMGLTIMRIELEG